MCKKRQSLTVGAFCFWKTRSCRLLRLTLIDGSSSCWPLFRSTTILRYIRSWRDYWAWRNWCRVPACLFLSDTNFSPDEQASIWSQTGNYHRLTNAPTRAIRSIFASLILFFIFSGDWPTVKMFPRPLVSDRRDISTGRGRRRADSRGAHWSFAAAISLGLF